MNLCCHFQDVCCSNSDVMCHVAKYCNVIGLLPHCTTPTLHGAAGHGLHIHSLGVGSASEIEWQVWLEYSKKHSSKLCISRMQVLSGVSSELWLPATVLGKKPSIWWTKLGLFPKCGKDQCGGEFYVNSLPNHFVWFGMNTAGYIVTKVCASQRNLTWLTRLFFLMRGSGEKTMHNFHC